MLQVYRVIAEFEAQQLPWEPFRMESFKPGDLLIVLNSEDSYTTFCRHDESTELDSRDQFRVLDSEFELRTESEDDSRQA